jgi:hypothetical protein
VKLVWPAGNAKRAARVGALGLTVCLVIGGCGSTASPPARGRPRLEDLSELRDLRDDFNRDKGAIRVVLLLSPT